MFAQFKSMGIAQHAWSTWVPLSLNIQGVVCGGRNRRKGSGSLPGRKSPVSGKK